MSALAWLGVGLLGGSARSRASTSMRSCRAHVAGRVPARDARRQPVSAPSASGSSPASRSPATRCCSRAPASSARSRPSPPWMLETERLGEEARSGSRWRTSASRSCGGLASRLSRMGDWGRRCERRLPEADASTSASRIGSGAGCSRTRSWICSSSARLHAAVLMRAVEGFGLKQTLRTDRLLTLSEDLPLVAVAVDERPQIEAALPASDRRCVGGGLSRSSGRGCSTDELDTFELPEELHEATKLTIYLGRDERVGRPAGLRCDRRTPASQRARRAQRCSSASTGWRTGERRRARFFSRNESGAADDRQRRPGRGDRAALRGLDGMLADPIVTLERVRVCKRDGAPARRAAAASRAGRRRPRCLAEADGVRGRAGTPRRHPLYHAADTAAARGRAQAARPASAASGASPATTSRTATGSSALRRQVPIVTTIVDRPDAIQRWFQIVDELTDEAGPRDERDGAGLPRRRRPHPDRGSRARTAALLAHLGREPPGRWRPRLLYAPRRGTALGRRCELNVSLSRKSDARCVSDTRCPPRGIGLRGDVGGSTMKHSRARLAAAAAVLAVSALAVPAAFAGTARAADAPSFFGPGADHAVFVQTDNTAGNQIVAYRRAADGTLTRRTPTQPEDWEERSPARSSIISPRRGRSPTTSGTPCSTPSTPAATPCRCSRCEATAST